ncbi:sensor histidine kinase [Planomonospora parontospora]|uniref:sensor histidine kinase n=1 Tax=Planomonospora parontospora TaxID=58119 RepID=UPI0016717D26|nr:nitrate- and nitrite sensing domain-containing protein [Planomonospora parontospora]GGL25531.1 ATPase [Planomonospora parontospora subsp. antibiotica]GII16326.1 ATPase [Planomonospora parontospora subsp. antibiotica]
MRLRNARLRTKVTALLMSLAALWAFTAWVTVRDGLNMLGVATLNSGVAEPSERLLVELQAERRLTVTLLGASGEDARQREALMAQRKRTDEAGANLRERSSSADVGLAASEELVRRIDGVLRRLDGLGAARQAIDDSRLDRLRSAEAFTGVIDALRRVYDAMAVLDDEEIAKTTRTLIDLTDAAEILAQEDALAAGALTAGRFTDGERVLFTQIVGTQRFLTAQAVAESPAAVQEEYGRLTRGEDFIRLRAMEDLLLQGRAAGRVDAGQWTASAQRVQAELWQIVLRAGDRLVEQSTPVAAGVIVRLALAGGLGLIAVIASVVLSITTARALIQQLEKLRVAAWELADKRLPGVVDRIGHGEEVDIAAEAPPLQFGDDQIGQVGQAFNAVQRTAIKVAVEQAQLRRDIADILRNLARRTQGLVHRQLTVLDTMERREQDPQELRDLFRLDHLATRMRRYAENLLVLAGAAPGRAWRDPVPMLDVVRGALAEIEDYTRVDVLPMGEASLDGRAVGDVIHLVAELVENAASFSPPYTTVKVVGHSVAHGYAIEIEDRGLGMSEEDIASANERIANPPELKLAGNARLGLYVVSRLAERHGVRVTFKASPYGGTTVVVLIPQGLVVQGAGSEDSGGVSVPAARTGAVPATRAEAEGRVSVPGRAEAEGRVSVPGRAEAGADAAVSGSSSPSILPPPDTSHTPGGLPRRVPQTHLAVPLREDDPLPEPEPPAEDGERSPEEIRAAFSSFQAGTRRGRSDAAQLLTGDGGSADGGRPSA